MGHYEHYIDDAETPRPAPKRRARSLDKFERVALVISMLAVAMAALGPRSVAPMRKNKDPGPALEVLHYPLPAKAEDPYDPAEELRVPVAEHSAAGSLEPVLIVLRGPWTFGVTEPDRLAVAIGKPDLQGSSYMHYVFSQAKVHLTVLFNVKRLDTIVLAPDSCDPGLAVCLQSVSWGLTKDQARDLQYEPSSRDPELCGVLRNATAGLSYAVCPAASRPDEWVVQGIYIQRLNKDILNPVSVRGVPPPGARGAGTKTAGNACHDYDRLLAQYQTALLLKQKALRPDHSSVRYFQFELGRFRLEWGDFPEGSRQIQQAAEALSRGLGPGHPDVAAMRAWASKTKPGS